MMSANRALWSPRSTRSCASSRASVRARYRSHESRGRCASLRSFFCFLPSLRVCLGESDLSTGTSSGADGLAPPDSAPGAPGSDPPLPARRLELFVRSPFFAKYCSSKNYTLDPGSIRRGASHRYRVAPPAFGQGPPLALLPDGPPVARDRRLHGRGARAAGRPRPALRPLLVPVVRLRPGLRLAL